MRFHPGPSATLAAAISDGDTTMAGIPKDVDVDLFPQESVIRASSRLVLVAAGNAVVTSDSGNPSVQPVSDGSTITPRPRRLHPHAAGRHHPPFRSRVNRCTPAIPA